MTKSVARSLESVSKQNLYSETSTCLDLTGFTVIYGGSFDPPHLGHQMCCLYLLEGLNAQNVWLLPSFKHPLRKKAVTDFKWRLAMTKILAKIFAKRVRVLALEGELGLSRTYDLLRYLRTKFPQRRFALALGADILAEKHLWYRFAELKQLAKIIVIGRSGYPLSPASLEEIAEEAPVLELPNIASSDIRQKLATGCSLRGLVPYAVLKFIEKHKLYRLKVKDF